MDEFAIGYESIFVDDEPEYNVFDFDICSVDFIAIVAFAYDTSTISLELKSFPDSLKYAFLGPDKSLPIIIAFELDQG